MLTANLGLVRGRDAWDQLIERWPPDSSIPPPSSITEWITSMLTTSYVKVNLTSLTNTSSVISKNVTLSEACVGSAVMVGLDYTAITSSSISTIEQYEEAFTKLTDTDVQALTAVRGGVDRPNGFNFRYRLSSAITGISQLPIIIYGVLKASQRFAAPTTGTLVFPALLAKGKNTGVFNSVNYVTRSTNDGLIVEEVITLENGSQFRALATANAANPNGFAIDGSGGDINLSNRLHWGLLGSALANNRTLVFKEAAWSNQYKWTMNSGGGEITCRVSTPTALPAVFQVTFNGPWSSFVNSATGFVLEGSQSSDSPSFYRQLQTSGWVSFTGTNGAFLHIYFNQGQVLIKTRYAVGVTGNASPSTVYTFQ